MIKSILIELRSQPNQKLANGLTAVFTCDRAVDQVQSVPGVAGRLRFRLSRIGRLPFAFGLLGASLSIAPVDLSSDGRLDLRLAELLLDRVDRDLPRVG